MSDCAICSRYSLLPLGVNPVAFKTFEKAENEAKRNAQKNINFSHTDNKLNNECHGEIYKLNDEFYYSLPKNGPPPIAQYPFAWLRNETGLRIAEFVDYYHVKFPFCDPLETMQIVRNRANNLFGKVRSDGSKPNSKNHQGFDYYALSGTEIRAVSNGVVKKIVNPPDEDYGMQIVIKIDNSEYYAFYAHLSEIATDVISNSIVKKGEIIGKTGISGNAKNCKGNDQHLHFECRTKLRTEQGLEGRVSPNLIVATKFYSQDETMVNGNYKTSQTITGVKKVDIAGTETLMGII